MRILTSSLALVLGLALAPAVALAQTSSTPPVQVGSGANNTKPVGGPGYNDLEHQKYHKRAHRKFYGRHHDYTKSSPAKGPTAAHVKQTGTD